MGPLRCFALLWLFCFTSLMAKEIDQLKLQQEQKLKSSRESLSALRETHTAQLLPLQRELRNLRADERSWRSRLEEHQSVQDSRTLSLEELKEDLDASREELQYLENVLLREFFAEHRSTLPVYSEMEEQLRKLDLEIESGALPEGDVAPRQIAALLDVARDLNQAYGGKWMEGKSLGTDGSWHEGKFLDLGPDAYFKSASSAGMGRIVVGNDRRPRVDDRIPLSDVSNWMKMEKGSLPFDVSGGQALMALETQTTFSEHLKKGGVWVIPICFFACLAALLALVKLLVLYTVRVSPVKVGHQLALLLRKGEVEQAQKLAEQQPHSCRSMWTRAVEFGQGDPTLTEEIMTEAILEKQPGWERFHSLIALTAAVAPLLGLLGTVTGIIKTFQMMEVFGAGDPRPLIGGISEALITTELGLILAIPALLLHAMLSRRAQSLLSRMERCSMATVNGLMGEAEKVSSDA